MDPSEGKWCQPVNRPDLKVSGKAPTYLTEGAFVQSALTGDILYVRKVNSLADIECSRVIKIQPRGTAVANGTVHRTAGNLKVVDPKNHMGYFSL